MNALPRTLALGLLASGLSTALSAQAVSSTAVPRVQGVMQSDGVLDEPFWQQAAVGELPFEISPGESTPASVRTTVLIADSGKSLRIAFKAMDPDVSKIVAPLRDRDSAYQDDFVGLRLDSFDSQQRAYQFFVSARGVQMDLTYDESNKDEDDSWDAIWDSGAAIGGDGYTVEMEIPYAALKFKHGTADQQWSVQFLRIRPREHRFTYSSNADDRNEKCDLCQQNKLTGFAHADPGRGMLVNPTLTAGYGQFRDQPGQAFTGTGTDVDVGLDLSWSPSPSNSLSLTYNPDFSQIEIDGAQLAVNTSFALFFPEKRPFFLESADFFNGPTQLVYTRNIADPDYGVRATGRQGDHTYGLFGADDVITNVLRPGPYGSRFGSIEGGSTDWVGTYRYSLDSTSHVGGLVTQRSGDGYHNTMLNLDGRWQRGAHTVLAQLMYSDTEDALGYSATPFTGNAFLLNYEYQDRQKSFSIGKRRHDPGFRADMGFVGQVDYERWVVGGSYRWYPQDSFFSQIRVNGDWDITHQISVERLMEREIEAHLVAKGRMQSYLELAGLTRRRFWNGTYYDENYVSFYGEATPYKAWQYSLYLRGGDQIDFRNDALGRIFALEAGVTGSFAERGSLQLSYIDEALRRDGGTVYHARLLDTRLSWQFNLRQRLRLAVQTGRTDFDTLLNPGMGDSELSDIGTQLVYSYKIDPRTVFYAGYSDSYIGSDSVDSFQTGRSLFLKLGYAWQP